MMKTKFRYSFKDRGTDGQTDGIDFRMYSQRPFKWYMTRLKKLKISWRRGKQYTSPVTLGGKHNDSEVWGSHYRNWWWKWRLNKCIAIWTSVKWLVFEKKNFIFFKRCFFSFFLIKQNMFFFSENTRNDCKLMTLTLLGSFMMRYLPSSSFMHMSTMHRRMPQALSMLKLIWLAKSEGLNCSVPKITCLLESLTL